MARVAVVGSGLAGFTVYQTLRRELAPASFISLIVPLVIFFAFQRYFVQGLLAGSVK